MASSMRGHLRGRGGRGARGGGRYKPGEYDLLQDPEYDRSKPQPTPLFPTYKPTTPKPLTKTEKQRVAHFLAFRKRLHDGPFYTILDEGHQVRKPREIAAALFDPFEGMPTYAHKYVKRRRTLPKLDERTYVKKFFPKELWHIIDAKNQQVRGPQGYSMSGAFRDKERDLSKAEGDIHKGEGEEPDVDDDDAREERAHDDEFEEEEEDEGDDYNAEQYFDGNQDEAGEEMDMDEGEGGGEYY